MKYAKIGKDDGSTQLGEHDFEMLKLDALDKMFLRKVYRSGNNYFMSVHNTCTWLCISKHTYKRMIKRLQKEGLLKVQQFTYKQSDNTFKSVTQHSVDLVALARFPRVQLLKTEKIYAPETGGQNGTPKDSEQNAPQPEQNAHDDGAKCTGEVSKMHPEGEQNGPPIMNPNEGTLLNEPLMKEPYLFKGEEEKKKGNFYLNSEDAYNQITTNIPLLKDLVKILGIASQTDEAKSRHIHNKLDDFLASTADFEKPKNEIHLHLKRWLKKSREPKMTGKIYLPGEYNRDPFGWG
jgi:hypothetical protein